MSSLPVANPFPFNRRGLPVRALYLLTLILALVSGAQTSRAYGPEGFNTVVIDAGHGGIDRGGGPGQRVPEKPYTLDTALRLQRALRSRGFRTVMTRTDDTFIPLRERVYIGASQSNAIFVSIHFNSAPREGAHGYETYYYRGDSFGLAARLHRAMLGTLDTEDRHVRRRAFYVLRNPRIPAVLCEGGFLTNYQESRYVTDASYRQRLADNLASAISEQSRSGDPDELGSQPAFSSERLVSSGRGRHRHGGGRHGRSRYSRGGRHHSSGRHSGGRHHSGGSSHHHRHRR
jgi:N-acetylmuramoyl-L-alanine amidase